MLKTLRSLLLIAITLTAASRAANAYTMTRFSWNAADGHTLPGGWRSDGTSITAGTPGLKLWGLNDPAAASNGYCYLAAINVGVDGGGTADVVAVELMETTQGSGVYDWILNAHGVSTNAQLSGDAICVQLDASVARNGASFYQGAAIPGPAWTPVGLTAAGVHLADNFSVCNLQGITYNGNASADSYGFQVTPDFNKPTWSVAVQNNNVSSPNRSLGSCLGLYPNAAITTQFLLQGGSVPSATNVCMLNQVQVKQGYGQGPIGAKLLNSGGNWTLQGSGTGHESAVSAICFAVPQTSASPVFSTANYGWHWYQEMQAIATSLPADWDVGDFKGMCQPGQAATGISGTKGGGPAHALQCGGVKGTTAAAPVSAAIAGAAGSQPFAPITSGWDWTLQSAPAVTCPQGQFIAGVSETTTGGHDVRRALCYPGATQISPSTCTTEYMYDGDSDYYDGNTSEIGVVDWDPGFNKGHCGPGMAMAGIAAVNNRGSMTPFTILCCPNGQFVGGTRLNSGNKGAVGTFGDDSTFVSGASQTIYHANNIDLSGVMNAAPTAVYQSARTGDFKYVIPGFVPGSIHTVRLHFCETYFSTAGSRVFDADINGNKGVSYYDIAAEAGKNKAVIKSFAVAADASGTYTITFTSHTNVSLISGVEIL